MARTARDFQRELASFLNEDYLRICESFPPGIVSEAEPTPPDDVAAAIARAQSAPASREARSLLRSALSSLPFESPATAYRQHYLAIELSASLAVDGQHAEASALLFETAEVARRNRLIPPRALFRAGARVT